jgi:hypothetical protein
MWESAYPLMEGCPGNGHSARMSGYAVIWQEKGCDPVYVGRAELDADGLSLHGRAGEANDRRHICDDDLSEVRRRSDLRIGPCEAMELRTRDGVSLLLAAPFGIGILTELFELLAVRLATFV